ncbi:MAG: potassium-transporting ATPase subunit KdpC [Actinomycetota bacterium]|nr:potassium-transporting ATPase subunit KdpC [Actinomycetota bacterium]
MIRTVVRALVATVVLAVLTGLLYPLAMTAIAQVAFRSKADGSLVQVEGRPVGSSLIGQKWSGTGWFYGRPSAVGDDASTSSGSNLGPTSQDLADEIAKRAEKIVKLEAPYAPGVEASSIPVDLLTASGSGLDPDISPAAAEFQAPRVAAVRGLSLDEVQALIRDNTEGRTLGVLGQPRVNVLELNLALEAAAPSA